MFFNIPCNFWFFLVSDFPMLLVVLLWVYTLSKILLVYPLKLMILIIQLPRLPFVVFCRLLFTHYARYFKYLAKFLFKILNFCDIDVISYGITRVVIGPVPIAFFINFSPVILESFDFTFLFSLPLFFWSLIGSWHLVKILHIVFI